MILILEDQVKQNLWALAYWNRKQKYFQHLKWLNDNFDLHEVSAVDIE